MRIERTSIAAALLLIASTALAQQTPNTPVPQVGENTGAPTTGNQVDVGFRGTAYGTNSDEARFQRFRDLRNGPFVEGLRYRKENDDSFFDARAEHVGYRDQGYAANYNRFGKLRVSFEWTQIPLFFSQDTSRLFTVSSPGVLTLPDQLQASLQNKTTTLAAAVAGATPFDLRLKRSIADFRATYAARSDLDLRVSFKETLKKGGQPWAGTFGFGNAVELEAPVDTRTTDLGVAAEWMRPRGELRVGYDGSFFHNNVSTLAWDNPLVATDSPTAGPVQGRMALWPDSTINTGSVSGLVKLPARSQATAYLSLGNWSQNELLIPFTTNSALPAIPLDRPTADAKARITATAFAFNSRPTDVLWLAARVRSYDFDNQTPIFAVANTVSYDTSPSVFADGGTSPYSFRRTTVDVEASWTPITYAAFRAGYTHDRMHQTFRTFDRTDDNVIRLSADATGIRWLTFRGVYEHGHRVGSGLDEQTLDDIGEQVSLRQFDVANRESDRFSSVILIAPVASLSFNGTAFVGRERRPDTVFGLRDNDNNGFSIGADYVPRDAVSLGAAYEYEKYSALQRSRQANPGVQFNDPTRDWTTDSADHVHTITASADLLKLWPRTDVRVALDVSRADSVYVYGLAPNSTLPTPGQLPTVRNDRGRFTLDTRYFLTKRLAAGVVYWYERYRVDDFALNPSTLTSIAQPSFLMLGYVYRPYTANTLWGRITYLW
jgi:MtrB/PioB family decaheme-associated outer membrane protein